MAEQRVTQVAVQVLVRPIGQRVTQVAVQVLTRGQPPKSQAAVIG